MKIYAVGNLKGGVGKTTTTVNLAYSMAVLKKKVLVIDADPQTNTTPFFTKIGEGKYTIRDLFLHPEINVNHVIYRSKYKAIDIIKGCTQMKETDVMKDCQLSEALQTVAERYDVCIIDTRPAFESITRNAILAADVLLTPVILDKFCRDNLLLVEDALYDFGGLTSSPEWKIFANKVENKRSQRNTYADMAEKHMWPFLDTCISKSAVTDNALEMYKPVLKHRSQSTVAADYLELARELLEVQ